MPNQHRILVVQTAFLGDLLLSIPLLKQIRKHWPQSHLILVCRQNLGGFFLEMKLVDEVIEIKKNQSQTYKEAHNKVGLVDLVFSPHSSIRTSFWVRSLKGRPKKIGYRSFLNRWIFSETVVKDFSLPDPLRQMQLLIPELPQLAQEIRHEDFYKPINGKLPPIPSFAGMSLQGQYAKQKSQLRDLEKKFSLIFARGLILIFPGSVWATKRWPAENYIQISQHFMKEQQVLIMGGPGEEALCAQIAAKVPGAIDLCGKTSLVESGLLLTQAKLMIGNDSASIHLAATADTPTLAIFGPTVPQFGFRPWQNHAWVAQEETLLCRPCGPHGHRQCPIGSHECMRRISANQVVALAKKILEFSLS